MKNLTDLMALVATLICNFIKNPETVYRRFEFFVKEEWEDLQGEVKIIFFGPFIDKGRIATPASTKATTILELLQELKKELQARNIPLYKYSNGEFYHPDTLTWFPNAKVHNNGKPSKLVFLPQGGMTEGKMKESAEKLKVGHKDYLSNYIEKVIDLVKQGFYDEPARYVGAFLEELKEDDQAVCKLWAIRDSDGRFDLYVSKALESDKWFAGFGLLLSNENLAT